MFIRPFSNLGLPFDYRMMCPKSFVMISLTVQELSCWQRKKQTNKVSHKQTVLKTIHRLYAKLREILQSVLTICRPISPVLSLMISLILQIYCRVSPWKNYCENRPTLLMKILKRSSLFLYHAILIMGMWLLRTVSRKRLNIIGPLQVGVVSL